LYVYHHRLPALMDISVWYSLPLLYYFKVITTLYLLWANKISDLIYLTLLATGLKQQ